MARRVSAIHIPTPCAESWAAMTPTSRGHHCAACRTEVVDFTQKSPAEILAYLRQASGRPICGRVYAAQTAPPVVAGNRWGHWVGTLLTVSSLGTLLLPTLAIGATLAVAKLPANPVSTSTALFQEAPELSGRLKKRLAASTLVVRGLVLDARTYTPAPGVTILLKDTNWATSTNADGRFELTVVPEGRQVELVVAFIGYKTLVKKLSIKECQAPIIILLKEDNIILGRISTPTFPRG
jgi:hypothetical protein